MSYGIRYKIPFLNREEIYCEIQLLSNDSYSGVIATLDGSDSPFVLQSQAQDNQIPYGIKATESTIEFYVNEPKLLYSGNDDIDFNSPGNYITTVYTGDAGLLSEVSLVVILGITYHVTSIEIISPPFGIKINVLETLTNISYSLTDYFFYQVVSLNTFYNESDTFWRADFYYNSALAWSGFLQLDNCSESITDIAHVIQLNANDGLSRLQALYFLDTNNVPYIRNWLLSDFLNIVLPSTGLALDTKAWLNIFENSTDDRSVHNYLTFLKQTEIPTRYFINDDGTTQTMYDVLNNFMTDFRCMLTQADGYWQIIRWGDVRIFSDGTMPGTLYNASFSTYSEILYPAAVSIGLGLPIEPINENQQQRILRPYQFSKETFNYQQPNFINQYDLQIATGATPFDTRTVGSLQYDDYDIATYFPDWTLTHSDGSYLETVYDTVQKREVDRYIITPGASGQHGVQFNPIPVTTGDSFDFSLQFKSITGGDHTFRFYIRFIIIVDNGTFYALAQFPEIGSTINVHWTGPFSTDSWDQNLGIYYEANNTTVQDWTDWSISQFLGTNQLLPQIPEDGMLLIEVRGTNGSDSTARDNTEWKSIVLTMSQLINQSTQITGQYHNNQQDLSIKSNLQRTPSYDDTPRNTIAGTLFTDALSNFDYADTFNGAQTNIGNIYFTRTALWHRQGITEARKLGDLNTFNDLFIQRIARTIVEGDFYGLTGIHLLALIQFSWLSNKKFIFGTFSANYMTGIWNATLYELFYTGEVDGDLDNTYTFNYIYSAQ